MALTGFLVNMGGGNPSVCASSSANAIQALGARFPYVAGNQPLLCNLESSVFTAPNTFTNTILCHDLTSNASFLLAHPLHLMMCDPALPIAGVGTPFDPVIAASYWMWAMTMVVGIWFAAHNSGSILRMVQGKGWS